jgi:hypothetical protein
MGAMMLTTPLCCLAGHIAVCAWESAAERRAAAVPGAGAPPRSCLDECPVAQEAWKLLLLVEATAKRAATPAQPPVAAAAPTGGAEAAARGDPSAP